MQVSVVMITRDRCAAARHSVAALRDLPERPQVIVVDNGSTDGTAKALSGIPGVRVIRAPGNLGAAGRTLGVRAASTPYVAFADDDSGWAPGSLLRAVELLDAHPRAAVLTGRTRVGPNGHDDPINALLAAAPAATEPDLPGPTALGFLACAAVVRRDAYLAVGGFHPRFGVGGEEELLALDLLETGWGLAYVPELVAFHHPQPDGGRSGRPVRQRRNALWTVWLRRRPWTVAAATTAALRRALIDPADRAALVRCAAGLPWVVRERRTVSPALEARLRRAGVAADPVPGPLRSGTPGAGAALDR